MSKLIPIENIYYLLCYAWDQLDEGELAAVEPESCESLQDLLARVLIGGTRRLIKRGFHRNYQEQVEETASLRGRIAFRPSIQKMSWTTGRMVCEFTELSYNTIPNRILKTTLRNLLYTRGVDSKIKDHIAGILHQLHEVTSIRLSRNRFRRIQYHQNLRFYRFLMNVCELVYESLIPTEEGGESVFRDFLRDEAKMAALFEAFVHNFYRHESNYKVNKSSFRWQEVEGDAGALSRLPTMNTDVELRVGNQLMILDCKYYREAFTYNRETERYKTVNLYQLYAYVKNKALEFPNDRISGILLYPEVQKSFIDRFILQNHPFTIASINLNQPWRNIRQDLLRIVEV